MEITRKRKVNIKNCYLLFISLIAIVSIIGNIYQDRFYNQALSFQDELLESYSQSNSVMDSYD
ncbi:MAG: hypothetical protein EOM50_00060 [Erysipelotrichia bacterium]|nr:hypothetical protein [Erysipelotrichia bacterium]NCC55009.1 hypothetical protein [Erysipelotrichia bacterium]